MFETLVKLMVACVVLCFMGVVGLLFANGGVELSEVLNGLKPSLKTLFEPSDSFMALIKDFAP